MKKILLVLIFFVTACSQDINYVENCADKSWLDLQSYSSVAIEFAEDKKKKEKLIKLHNDAMYSFKTFSLNEKLNTNNNKWYGPGYEDLYKKCQNEYRKNKSLFEAKHSS